MKTLLKKSLNNIYEPMIIGSGLGFILGLADYFTFQILPDNLLIASTFLMGHLLGFIKVFFLEENNE